MGEESPSEKGEELCKHKGEALKSKLKSESAEHE